MHERTIDEVHGVPDEARTALVRGLSASTGAEAMFALFDVVGLDRAAVRATVSADAEVLVADYL